MALPGHNVQSSKMYPIQAQKVFKQQETGWRDGKPMEKTTSKIEFTANYNLACIGCWDPVQM